MSDPWLWLGLFVFVAYTVEAVTGFGSIVIALSLGALLLPIPELLPVLVPLNILMTGYLSVRHWRSLHWPTLLRKILPLMALGTAVGYAIRPILADTALKAALGILIVWFAGRELWQRYRAAPVSPLAPGLARSLILGAGATHGLFASGGPLLVYALAGTPLDKTQLRTTLIAVWFCLNCSLTLAYLMDGTLLPSVPRLLGYMPVVAAGVLIGEWLHHRIDEQRFRQLVFALLMLTGAALALPL